MSLLYCFVRAAIGAESLLFCRSGDARCRAMLLPYAFCHAFVRYYYIVFPLFDKPARRNGRRITVLDIRLLISLSSD
jgi:hypothetical protein